MISAQDILSGGGDIWDFSDPASDSGSAPTDFSSNVLSALLGQGIDVTTLSPDQLQSLISALMNTPRIRNLFGLYDDPGQFGSDFVNIQVTAADLRKAISDELFNPAVSSSSMLVNAGLSLRMQQGLPLDTAQQDFVLTGAGGAGDVRSTIISIAGQLGVDPALALAIAQQESGLNPSAIGDGGHSVGLFQLNDQGEGAGMSVAEREDPVTNARIALSVVAQVAAAHPDWSPGQIAAAAQRPADRAGYAAAVDALYGPIRAGKLPTGGGASVIASLEAQYPGLVSTFEQYTGRKPTVAELEGIIGMNPDQLDQYMRSQPSHLPGLSFGAYHDLRAEADRISNNLFGHGVTDGMIQEMQARGMTSPASVTYYLEQMDIAGKMDPQVYQMFRSMNRSPLLSIYNEQGFDPRMAHQQYQQALDAGITAEQMLQHARIHAADINRNLAKVLDIGAKGLGEPPAALPHDPTTTADSARMNAPPPPPEPPSPPSGLQKPNKGEGGI